MRIVPQDSPTLFDGKVCTKCEQWKLLTDFYHRKDGSIFSQCKRCNIAAVRQKQATYPNTREALPTEKRCSRCQIVKLTEQFNRQMLAADGLCSECKECTKAWRAIYVSNNREKVRLLTRARNHKRRDARNAASKLWRLQNAEYAAARQKAYREKRREYYNERRRAWYQRHPDYVVLRGHVKRARIRNNGGRYTVAEWKALCEQHDNRCLCCGEQVKLTVDHVIPISKAGRNDIANIQPLCLPCNMLKGNQTIDYRPK